MTECVTDEHLAAQHHEVPDQSRQRRDRDARKEGLAHEGLGEQVAEAGHARPRASACQPCASRYVRNARLVRKNPIGYGE